MFVRKKKVLQVKQRPAVALNLFKNRWQGIVGHKALFAAEKTNNQRMVFHKAFLVKDKMLVRKFLPLREKSFYGLHDLS